MFNVIMWSAQTLIRKTFWADDCNELIMLNNSLFQIDYNLMFSFVYCKHILITFSGTYCNQN